MRTAGALSKIPQDEEDPVASGAARRRVGVVDRFALNWPCMKSRRSVFLSSDEDTSLRPTLAVIVGSGASIASGVPSSKDLLAVVRAALIGRVKTQKIDGTIEETAFPLWEVLKKSLSTRRQAVGFESIVAAIEELLSYGLGDGPLIRSFTELRSVVSDVARTEVLFNIHEFVIQAILGALLKGQPRTREQLAAHESLLAFVRRLSSSARIVLVTLNYDTLLDDALTWSHGFTQVSSEYAEFDPSHWHAQTATDHLLLHVHGSVRFGMRPSTMFLANAPFNEPVRYATQQLAIQSLSNTSSPSADGHLLSAGPIVAGGHKSAKLMLNSRPYAYYNATALEAIANARGLLILGYGFGDAHVNAWIDEHMRARGCDRLAIVGRRTSTDIGKNTLPTEIYLRRLAQSDFDNVYVPVEGGAPPSRLHGPIGDAYFVASGVPLTADAEEAVIQYLMRELP